MLTKVLAPSTLLQAAIPDVIKNVPDSHVAETMAVFESNSSACYSRLKDVPGLHPIRATGSMYIMVRLHALLDTFVGDSLFFTWAIDFDVL